MQRALVFGMTLLVAAAVVSAQNARPASPAGTSATQLGEGGNGSRSPPAGRSSEAGTYGARGPTTARP